MRNFLQASLHKLQVFFSSSTPELSFLLLVIYLLFYPLFPFHNVSTVGDTGAAPTPTGATPPSVAVGLATVGAEETKADGGPLTPQLERKGSGAGDREPRRSKGGDDDDDSDFEAEIDPYLINNDLDPITPQSARAASRAGWV